MQNFWGNEWISFLSVYRIKTGSIGLIQLNRPDSLNALTSQMVLSLFDQLMAWKSDSTIKAVVIKSLHDKVFSAGGDVPTNV